MMKNLLLLVLTCSSMSLIAQDDMMAQKSIQGLFTRNIDQIMGLAEAFDDDQYDWRPEEGVRSVGEALLHVAQANYFFLMKMGFELPENVDMMTMPSLTGKDKIMAAVQQSFDFTQEKMGMVPTDQLEETVVMPFGEFSKLSSLLILLEHSGEHKGQLIAYARSNGIVPPWSE